MRMTLPVWSLTACLTGLLAFLAAGRLRAEGDEVVLGGARIRCEIVEVGATWLKVRVGDRVYELEREGLEASQDGRPLPDMRRARFVSGLVRWLAGPDLQLARAAEAGLRALGDVGVPYLRAERARAGAPAVQAALDALLAPPGGAAPASGPTEPSGTAGLLDLLVERARASLALTPGQEAPVRAALAGFLAALGSGVPRAAAADAVRKSLAQVLTPEQLAGLAGWLERGQEER